MKQSDSNVLFEIISYFLFLTLFCFFPPQQLFNKDTCTVVGPNELQKLAIISYTNAWLCGRDELIKGTATSKQAIRINNRYKSWW